MMDREKYMALILSIYRLPQDIDYPAPKSKSKIIKVTGSEDVKF